MRETTKPAKKRQVRLGYLVYAMVLEEMLSGPVTARAIADHTGLGHRYVCRMLKAMHQRKVVHLSGWDKDVIGRNGVRVYSLGPGRDVPKPAPKPREEINRTFRLKAARAVTAGTPFYGLGARA